MATKTSRKELREPDEFITLTHRVLQWLNQQKVPLIVGAAALILVIVGVVGWNWYVESAEKDASRSFVEAYEILDARVAPGEEGTTSVDGTYATEEDKYRAAIAALEQVRTNHESTSTADLAGYFIGECHRRLGEHQKAIEHLEQYLEATGPDGELAVFALEGIGLSLEALGRTEEAAKRFRRLTEEPFDREPDRGLYHLARLEQKAGHDREAAKKFTEIVEKYPGSVFLPEIESRLELLPGPAATGDEAAEDEPAEAPEGESAPEGEGAED